MKDGSLVPTISSLYLTRRRLFHAGAAIGMAAGGARLMAAPVIAAQATPPPAAEGEYLVNAADFVAAADWGNRQDVVIELSETMFSPSELTFEAGTPYVLTLHNTGAEKHYFTAHEFYRSIATRKVETVHSEIKVRYFTAIEVFPGQKVELFFVPVKTGTFDFFCEIEGHADAGMRGTITVTGETMTEPAPILAPIAEGDWLQGGEDRVQAANWDAMETVSIELGNMFFKPNVILLTVDQPYMLELKNTDNETHEFTASEFYQSVALRKAQDASGEYKGLRLTEIEVFEGQQTDLYLIPAVTGVFDLVCEIELGTVNGHLEQGMFGKIIVAESGTYV